MSDQENVKVKDESKDHIYFIITPRLVWALCENPDEFTLWCVVKDIAGESGECILSRDDLASMAMMSAGRVSECRESLMRKKLLDGDFRRDPGYPQKVWHFAIPDIWEANVRWAKKYIALRDRVTYKKAQQDALKELRKASRGDGLKDASSSDEGVSPDDGGISPDDAKNNVFKNQKEEIKNSCLEILQSLGYSVFGNDMTIWWNFRHRLDREDISITGDKTKMVISGLSEKPKDGQFTQAEIWQERIAPSYARLGLELEFLA